MEWAIIMRFPLDVILVLQRDLVTFGVHRPCFQYCKRGFEIKKTVMSRCSVSVSEEIQFAQNSVFPIAILQKFSDIAYYPQLWKYYKSFAGRAEQMFGTLNLCRPE